MVGGAPQRSSASAPPWRANDLGHLQVANRVRYIPGEAQATASIKNQDLSPQHPAHPFPEGPLEPLPLLPSWGPAFRRPCVRRDLSLLQPVATTCPWSSFRPLQRLLAKAPGRPPIC
jgi:hypothetical protein